MVELGDLEIALEIWKRHQTAHSTSLEATPEPPECHQHHGPATGKPCLAALLPRIFRRLLFCRPVQLSVTHPLTATVPSPLSPPTSGYLLTCEKMGVGKGT